jgi:hypothetical protein
MVSSGSLIKTLPAIVKKRPYMTSEAQKPKKDASSLCGNVKNGPANLAEACFPLLVAQSMPIPACSLLQGEFPVYPA